MKAKKAWKIPQKPQH